MTEDLLKMVDLLTLRGCSQRTINNYVSSIKRFKKYYDGKEVGNFTETDILDYLKTNFINCGRKAATVNLNRAAIIYYYLVNFNKSFNKILLPSCKIDSRFPTIFSKEDILKLLQNSNSLRLQLFICFGFGSGLRIAEVSSLNIHNFDIQNHRIKIIGKGNKERFTILPNYTLKLLKVYYSKNKDSIVESGGYLFPTNYSNSKCSHIKDNTIGEIFRKLLKDLDFSYDITFHTLRHSFATEYIKNGGDIWQLKSLLGHSSINSTTIYLHMANDFSLLTSPLDEVL